MRPLEVDAVPTARRRVLVLSNEGARSVSKNLDRVVATLSELGFELLRPDLPAPDSIPRAVREHAAAADMMVAIGGDGTLNAVLQGLIGTGLPLGIVPLGTANSLCKTLGIPADPIAACDVIAGGHTRSIDVGRVNGTYYFNEASIGLSVTLSRRLTAQLKSRLGIFAHLFEALSVMQRTRRFRAVIRVDGDRDVAVHTAQLTVGNSRNFGGVLASDEASIDDRRLDLYSVEFRHWWDYFEVLVSLLRRRFDDAETVLTMHARRFEVRTGRPMSIEADGEIVSKTPAVFEVVPQAVKVFVPKTHLELEPARA